MRPQPAAKAANDPKRVREKRIYYKRGSEKRERQRQKREEERPLLHIA